MGPALLIGLLGKPLNNNKVRAALKWYKIRKLPKVHTDMEGTVINFKDWVINSNVGIEFGFEDEISFNGYSSFNDDLMLLTQIYLYGDHDGVKVFQGSLPFDIKMSDDRSTVRKKLTSWETTRRSYIRDVWELPECRLTVSYVKKGTRIGFILLWSRQNSLSLSNSPTVMPGIQKIIKSLGKNIQDIISSNLFNTFPIGNQRDIENIDFQRSYGFKLRFLSNLGLSHVIFYRRGEGSLHGWQGKLPYSLEFDDSPEIVIGKMGKPETLEDELFVGNALWNFEDYCVRVNYCTMKNYILSIDLLTPDTLEYYSND